MILDQCQEFSSPGEALTHFGVKGMHWGVRKERETAGSKPKKSMTSEEKRARAKKVALGVGVLLAVAGTAFVAYKLNQSGNLPVSSLRKTKPTPAVKKILQEPTDIIHVGGAKNNGYSFLRKGNTPDYASLMQKAFPHGTEYGDTFKHMPDGSIAAQFFDPKGHKDAAGRVIPHNVIIPKSMTAGIHSIEDVKKHIWPIVEPAQEAYYHSPARQRKH